MRASAISHSLRAFNADSTEHTVQFDRDRGLSPRAINETRLQLVRETRSKGDNSLLDRGPADLHSGRVFGRIGPHQSGSIMS